MDIIKIIQESDIKRLYSYFTSEEFSNIKESYFIEYADDIYDALTDRLSIIADHIKYNPPLYEKFNNGVYNNFMEKYLSARTRNNLDEREFGIPELRKYPMPDKKHVLSAIKFFNHVEPKYEKELARNILSKMKKYDLLGKVKIGKENKLQFYISESINLDGYSLNGFNEFTVGAMLPIMGNTKGFNNKNIIKRDNTHSNYSYRDTITDTENIDDISDGIGSMYTGINERKKYNYIYENVSEFEDEVANIYNIIGDNINQMNYGLLHTSAKLQCKNTTLDIVLQMLISDCGYDVTYKDNDTIILSKMGNDIIYNININNLTSLLSITYEKID